MKRKILLGLTGSVATTLYLKLLEKLSAVGEVSVILTEKARPFICDTIWFKRVVNEGGGNLYEDNHEWHWDRDDEYIKNCFHIPCNMWKKNDPVLHINLRDKASALVIAPCSANTLAKVSYGLCDNLLTTIARSWDLTRPFVIAPAMNTAMLKHPTTSDHIDRFRGFSRNCRVVPTQSKMLACGTYGEGAMGEIESVVALTKKALRWEFPLRNCNGIPATGHPGSFACQRKHEKHTGVDLYTNNKEIVHAVEAGTVVGIEHFTGSQVNSPWWNDTDCLLIEGATGVVVYGEINVFNPINIGDKIEKGQYIGNVKQVLKDGKKRNDVMGHSTSMLHMELYPHGEYKAAECFNCLLNDVTPYLLEAEGCPNKMLTI